MPAEVKILVEGDTNADFVSRTEIEKTRPTITLVRDKDLIMVVDPGILESQQVLTDALQKENLTVEDVDVVCITHSHIDHYRNIGMFPRAKVLEYYGLWDKDTVKDWSENFTPNIQILHTPGHDYTGITLFVTTQDGIVAICGDIFWKENHPENPIDDNYASDFDKLKKSREMILKTADWIIPGHGPMYENDRSIMPGQEDTENKKSKSVAICKKCGRRMREKDKCQCRPQLCYNCCQCGLDCNNCSCSHRIRLKNSAKI